MLRFALVSRNLQAPPYPNACIYQARHSECESHGLVSFLRYFEHPLRTCRWLPYQDEFIYRD